MNKIAIIVVAGLLVSGIVFVLITNRPKNTDPTVKGIMSQNPIETITPVVQSKTYTNPSGFSFTYPETFTLSEKEVDESTYALVELTNPQNKDIVSIKLEDSNLAEIDDWFTPSNKKDIIGEIKDIKLADLDGRQFTDKENQMTTIALDKGGVLITISGNSTSIHQEIISSFIFTQTAQTTTDTSNTSDNGDVIFEGEETIE